MTLPNLILAGFPKCGTTSVAETLVRHPDVCRRSRTCARGTSLRSSTTRTRCCRQSRDYARHYARGAGERIRLDDTPVWAYGGADRRGWCVRCWAAAGVDHAARAGGAHRVLPDLEEAARREWSSRSRWATTSRSARGSARGAVDTAELNPWSGLYGSDYGRYLPAWLEEFGTDLRIGFLDDLVGRPARLLPGAGRVARRRGDAVTPELLQVANTAKAVRNPRAERVIRRVGRRVQPLARHAPGVYRALRDGARRANMTDVLAAPATDDAAARDELRRSSPRAGPPWPNSSGAVSWSGSRTG